MSQHKIILSFWEVLRIKHLSNFSSLFKTDSITLFLEILPKIAPCPTSSPWPLQHFQNPRRTQSKNHSNTICEVKTSYPSNVLFSKSCYSVYILDNMFSHRKFYYKFQSAVIDHSYLFCVTYSKDRLSLLQSSSAGRSQEPWM